MDILFAQGSSRKVTELSEETFKDIALNEILCHLSGDSEERRFLKKMLMTVPCEPSDMIFRQQILRDLIKNEQLCTEIKEILNKIKTLNYLGGVKKATNEKDTSLYTLITTLRELVVYVDTVEGFYKGLSRSDISSDGLIALRDAMESVYKDEKFDIAKKDIELMHKDLSNVRAAVIGVNFTPDLEVEKVTAIDFVDTRIRSNYTLGDLAALRVSTPLHKYKHEDPLLAAITPHMEKHLRSHFFEIKKILTKYVRYDTRFLMEMYEGFVFYLKCAELGRRLMDKGYEITFPEITAEGGSELHLTDFYNIRLAFSGEQNIVKNDFSFSEDERIFILTGPNRGGKTILEQSIGLISVMMSHGLFVTAGKCAGLPFGKILTHFPIDENLTINYGRLGEEAVRIKEIVRASDDRTLILFNETFSTTSATDGLYLSKDLIRVLKEKGAYVIFNTHIHDLAREIPEMNTWNGRGEVTSLVMERKDDKNTFLLKRAEPDIGSYARDIAVKYGITYEQMSEEKGNPGHVE